MLVWEQEEEPWSRGNSPALCEEEHAAGLDTSCFTESCCESPILVCLQTLNHHHPWFRLIKHQTPTAERNLAVVDGVLCIDSVDSSSTPLSQRRSLLGTPQITCRAQLYQHAATSPHGKGPCLPKQQDGTYPQLLLCLSKNNAEIISQPLTGKPWRKKKET